MRAFTQPATSRPSLLFQMFGHKHLTILHDDVDYACCMLNSDDILGCRYFVSLISACGVALLLLAPMVNLKNFVQREAARKAKLQ